MDTKQNLKNALSTRIMATGLLLVALLAARPAQAQTRAQDKARGEEMVRHARAEFAEANQLSEAASAAAEKAEADQEAASKKREDAAKLQREGFALIRDSNRARAAELRARIDEQKAQARSEDAELKRLQRLLKRQQDVASDNTGGAASLRATANTEANPTDKAELEKMAQTFTEQAAQANEEAAALSQRIAPLSAELARLEGKIKSEREMANRLAPEEK
jgi:hypothetical protein